MRCEPKKAVLVTSLEEACDGNGPFKEVNSVLSRILLIPIFAKISSSSSSVPLEDINSRSKGNIIIQCSNYRRKSSLTSSTQLDVHSHIGFATTVTPAMSSIPGGKE